MLGKLQQKKIERLFRAIDRDGDGLLEAGDFSALASKLAIARKIDMSSALYKEMHATQLTWWEEIRRASGKDFTERVTLNEWITFWGAWLTIVADEAGSGQQNALKAMKDSAAITFDIVDGDRDGRVTPSEYESWTRSFVLDDYDARANFRRLDRNQDGVLTRDEVVSLLKEFFLTNDPESPGNHLYGPLF